jgi:deazaflavin-dependent oxidoreductase (nitroreductase family)
MAQTNLQEMENEQFLYLITTGRKSGLQHEIEIWFVLCGQRFYLFAETGERAGWIKNIRHRSGVTVRIGNRQIKATARVLDHVTDRKLCDQVCAIAEKKYGWGDGLPVEITPLGHPSATSDHAIKRG